MKFENIAEQVVEFIITMSLKELSQLTRYKIADHFGINKTYLSGKFKKSTQMTLRQFLNQEKMRRAELLLRTRQNLSVKTISKIVGCERCELFRKNFRKVYCINPGKYRNMAKNLPPFCVNVKNRCVRSQKRQQNSNRKV